VRSARPRTGQIYSPSVTSQKLEAFTKWISVLIRAKRIVLNTFLNLYYCFDLRKINSPNTKQKRWACQAIDKPIFLAKKA